MRQFVAWQFVAPAKSALNKIGDLTDLVKVFNK